MKVAGVLILLLGSVWGYTRLWGRIVGGKIRYSVAVSEGRPREGEEIELRTILENNSWLPVPWIQLSQPLPEGTVPVEEGEGSRLLRYATYLLPRQRVQRIHRLRCVRRGLHGLPTAEIRYSDGLGWEKRMESLEPRCRILVRPRPKERDVLPFRFREWIGEVAVRRWYQEDPSRLWGVRQFRPGDPYRYIHWAASARTGKWLVKQFETSSRTALYGVLNHQLFEPHWLGSSPRRVDEQCRLAAALFRQSEELGLEYGLYSNGSWRGRRSLSIPPGRSPEHLEAVETALGRLLPQAQEPLADLLRRIREEVSNPSFFVVMTGYWDENLTSAAEELRRRGHDLVLVCFRDPDETVEGFESASSIPLITVSCQTGEEGSA